VGSVVTAAGPLKVALVGCGAVARLYYTPALHELEKVRSVQVAALYDPHPGNAARIAQNFPGAARLGELAELARVGVDLAIIASPPRYHAEQAIQLSQSGLSVLCEKPMAATVAEAEAMVEAAGAARRVLAIGLVRRFLPACQTIRSLLAQRVLGEIRSFHFIEGGRFRWPTESTTYFDRSVAIGGVLADIGAHLLDLLVWWIGEPAEVHYADDAMGGTEVNCHIELKMPGGFGGLVRLSRDCELRSRCFIRGSEGWLSWSIDAPEELQLQFKGTEPVVVGRLHEQDSSGGLPGAGRRVRTFEQSFIAQLRNVVAAVRGQGEPLVTGRDALAGLRLVERCYLHRTLMPMGWLNEREQARAQILARGASSC
jgi:predicted dehydrogenase